MPRRGGIVSRLIEASQEATGVTVVPVDRLAMLEATQDDYRLVTREYEDLGYSVLNYFGGRPQEVTAVKRRSMAQKARWLYMNDPMAGAAVDRRNQFVFGRGVPMPRAHDDLVQETIEEAWNDPDNQRVLTSFRAQMELGTDLSVQDNVFLLLFDEGEDGKVKLGLLNHDTVEDAVTDPDNRLRVLYYYTIQRKVLWDFKNHMPKADLIGANQGKKLYYAHWQGLQAAEDEEDREDKLEKPAAEFTGDGKVYHIAMNKGMEAVFGTPEFQRTMRWFNSYNEFMMSRVDMVKAAAAFVMKRKVKGTPNQLTKMATKALTKRSDLQSNAYASDQGVLAPPMSGSILNENENVSHENFKIDSGGAAAAQDALSLRAQVSAGTGFPQHYLGDAGSANLATATSMELPVLKMVEAWQEVFEQVFRWFVDRVIERAVETGRIPDEVEGEELAENLVKKGWRWFEDEDGVIELREARQVVDTEGRVTLRPTGDLRLLEGQKRLRQVVLKEAHEDKVVDEETTKRDLGYDFSMPPALKRQMMDLVTAAANVARTWDPNNTNLELSKEMLLIVLADAFEVQDAVEVVERIFPEGYVDPAIAAAQAQMGGPPMLGQDPNQAGGQPNFFSPDFQGGQDPNNPYGAPMKGTPAEKVRIKEAAVRTRDGSRMVWGQEASGRSFDELEALFSADAQSVTAERLERMVVGNNGANP